VRGQVESIRWEESRDREAISISQGLVTSMSMGQSWTIHSGAWNFLKQHTARQEDLNTFVGEEVARQQAAEEAGYRTPTWTVLRKLQALNEARRIDGGTVITLPPFLDNATRSGTELWGESDGPTVYLWDTLTEEEKKTCKEQLERTKDWVVWCKSNTEIDDTHRKPQIKGIPLFATLHHLESQLGAFVHADVGCPSPLAVILDKGKIPVCGGLKWTSTTAFSGLGGVVQIQQK
jgi:hypothetical protein